jgi:G3E family GTPase
MMIAKTKPDRILIEPTGLGHPEEIINTLLGEYYNTVLDLRATLTLVDPRKLGDSRYTENANFQDQIAVADVLVANKTDECGPQERCAFDDLLNSFAVPKQASFWIERGQLEASWLDFPRAEHAVRNPKHHQKNRLSPQRELYNANVSLPENERFIRRENSSNGFYSCGWLFQPEIQFDFNQLFGWLSGAPFLRVKAVMHTNEGLYMFNAENGVLSVNEIPVQSREDIMDSRIEVIDDKTIYADANESILLNTILSAT